MKTHKKLVIQCTEPQLRFHSLTCQFPAFVGGFGSGKTNALINQAMIDASASKEALIALYEPTYDLIRLILAPRLLEELDKWGIEYEYNKTEQHIRTKSVQFGDFILRSLDNPERIVGYESYRAHIDEIDTLNEDQATKAWDKIIARNRQTLSNVPIDKQSNRVCAYSTPEGFRFVYNRWEKNGNEDYQMVKASSRSNPFLPKGYIESLEKTYSPEAISAYIEGEFVNLNSGTVYNCYNRKTHSCLIDVEPYEPIYIGMDFNVTKMAATCFIKDEDAFCSISEFVNLYDTPAMILAIKARYPNNRIIVYPDATGTSRDPADASKSSIALLLQAGFEVRAHRKNPDVKDRIQAVNTAFRLGKLYINHYTCPVTAECLEQQSYDDKGKPDKTAGKDHQNDALGYLIAYEMPVHKPVSHYKLTYPD